VKAYGYTAYTESGKRRRGTVVAETEAQAAQILLDQGLFVSALSSRGSSNSGTPGRRRWRARLGPDLQAVLTRQMAVLLSAGLPVEQVLESVRAAGSNTVMDAVAARARAALMQGSSLAQALAQSGAGFPRYYLAAIKAGEQAGDLTAVFEELANHLEQATSDRAQITTALIYPAFVATVSLLVSAVLMINVAPEIVAMFEISGRPLPVLTQRVLMVSNWIGANPVLLAALALALVAAGLAAARVPALRRRRDLALLRLPLVGRLMRQAAAVQYLRTLALVLTSRHAVLSAVDSAAEVLSVARFQAEAAQVCAAVRSGDSLSSALDQLSFLPPVARQLVSAGEASARLARMAERSAVLVENALSTERKRIAALLEPLLMMLVGGFVLMIVLAVLLPIFDLQAAVTI
jgi:general secretion pathway protein F